MSCASRLMPQLCDAHATRVAEVRQVDGYVKKALRLILSPARFFQRLLFKEARSRSRRLLLKRLSNLCEPRRGDY